MRRQRKGEEGFAVLMIFVMAAIIAISLYNQLPRAAFEAQRNKEETLIQRGEQYKRGIQLYYRKFRKYPSKMEDLENTNNIRFLRRRFVDPMTGKDEWRLIHISGPGIYTDSLTIKPPKPNSSTNGFGTSTVGTSAIGSSNSTASSQPNQTGLGGGAQPNQQVGTNPGQNTTPGLPPISPPAIPGLPDPFNPNNPNNPNSSNNPALRRRPSDRVGAPGTTPAPGDPNALPNPGDPTQPQLPGVGTLPPILQPGQQPPQPGINNPAVSPNGQQYVPTTQQPNVSGATGLGNTSGAPGGPPTDAGALIMRQLTQGNPNAPNLGGAGPSVFGAGIAGVATKYEGEGIKIYNEHSKYNEWEFIYDPNKEAAAAIGAMPGMNQPGNNNGLNPSPAPTKPNN